MFIEKLHWSGFVLKDEIENKRRQRKETEMEIELFICMCVYIYVYGEGTVIPVLHKKTESMTLRKVK